MTTEYNPEELSSKHAVYYPPIENAPTLYYYDFSQNKYRPCKLTESLPYDLGMYKFQDENANTVFVTCSDSYRLSDDPDGHIDPSEKEWRDVICQNDDVDELDFYDNNNNWIKAEVAWKKADIVPNVLCLQHRKTILGLGYYYIESKRLAKSATYTQLFTQEELDKEIQDEIESKKQFEEEKEIILNIRKRLPTIYFDEGKAWAKDMIINDLTSYYGKLNLIPQMSDEELMKKTTDNNINKLENVSRALLTLISENCDGAYYDSMPLTLEYNSYDKIYYSQLLSGCDCICDIKVNGLTPDDCESIKLTYNFHDDVCDGIWNGNEFIFPDFTITNPLVKPMMGTSLQICIYGLKKENKDDIKCHCKGIMLNIIPRKIVLENGPWAVSKVPSKSSWLLAGHLWCPSKLVPYDEIEISEPEIIDEIDKINEENNEISFDGFIQICI